jgi:hypothetical protein
MLRKWHLSSFPWSGFLAGSIIALALSLVQSRSFKPEFQDPNYLTIWYVVSFLLGGGAGSIGGFLAILIPIRLPSIVGVLTGAGFGALGYYLQISLLLSTVFRVIPNSF